MEKKLIFRKIANIAILLVLLFTVLDCRYAYGYIDPGSGSMIIQIIIGFFLGALFVFKSFFKKIKDFIISIFKRKPAE